jgi:hypothetical protein
MNAHAASGTADTAILFIEHGADIVELHFAGRQIEPDQRQAQLFVMGLRDAQLMAPDARGRVSSAQSWRPFHAAIASAGVVWPG